MTPKQERFLIEYRGKGDGARAARAAGYSENRANTIAWSILNNPVVKAQLNEALDTVGLDAGSVCEGIINGLSAEVVKTASFEGKITDEKLFPDYQVRHKYLETLIKLRDMFPAEKSKIEFDLITPETQQAATARVDKLLAKKQTEANTK